LGGRHTSVLSNVNERELCILADREGKGQGSVLTLLHRLLEVAHEVARQVERCRDTNLLDVLFDICLGLKVRNVRKATVCDLADVQQRGEDQMLDTKLFGGIRNVLALAELDVVLCALPVIGDKEDGVRSSKSLGDGGLVAQVGLYIVSRVNIRLRNYFHF
jgi:hypothetical protein